MTISAGMLIFLLLQIAKNYYKYNGQNAVSNEMHLNELVNSYAQVNSKKDNLYIESDIVNILDNEIIFKNNILNSSFGYGQSNVVIYNRITKDVFLEKRPKFIFREGGGIEIP
jgi:hypothetical protein